MKSNSLRYVLLYFLLFVFLLVNSFVSGILKYSYAVVLLLVLLVLLKIVFGFEKDHHRYVKDISINFLIILMIAFLLFYLCGLKIGFMRTEMHYSFYGLTHFLIPFSIIILLKEFLRYQFIEKTRFYQWLIFISFVFFSLFDILLRVSFFNHYSRFELFLVFALIILPAIIQNIVATYICLKVGYKPNMIWLFVILMYRSLLPIVPNTGDYILSILRLLFPLFLLFHVYSFFKKRNHEVPHRESLKKPFISLGVSIIFAVLILYFTTGYFRYYVVAIATGSMTPNINKGDVVLLEQKVDYQDIKVEDVLVYRYDNRVIVHRIIDIIENQGHYFFYTKGDANNAEDHYVIYEDMVIGVVRLKIPYIGYPTVWLNELM